MSGRIRRVFTRNLGLKFLSLILAVILWYMAVGRERAEVGMNVPLELVNIPKDMVISNQPPDAVNIRVQGSVTLARQVADRKLRFSLDLSGAKKGPNDFSLHADQLDLPRGLEVTRLAPAKVTVELEGLVVKSLSLLPVIMGEPLPGYIIEDISLDPKSVAVRGPESVIQHLDILWTEPVDVTKLKAPVTIRTRPALPEVSLSLVEPVEIKANLGIVEKTVTKDFSGVPVIVQGEPGKDMEYTISPDSVSLMVKGPVNDMPGLKAGDQLTASVNIGELPEGVHERLVIVNKPPKFEVLKVDPRLIHIEIKLKKPVEPTDKIPNGDLKPPETVEPETPPEARGGMLPAPPENGSGNESGGANKGDEPSQP